MFFQSQDGQIRPTAFPSNAGQQCGAIRGIAKPVAFEQIFRLVVVPAVEGGSGGEGGEQRLCRGMERRGQHLGRDSQQLGIFMKFQQKTQCAL
jgi:hypothetical protein